MQERAQRTRQIILQAAAEAFEINGYGATRLQDIIARHEVSKGALYFHFPSKKSLAVAVIQEHNARWHDLIAELCRAQPRAIRVLVEFSWRMGRAFRNSAPARASTRLMLETRLSDPFPPPFLGWIRSVQELLEEAREQGDLMPDVAIDSVARFMVATFTGLQQLVMADRSPPEPERCISEMWRCLLPGLVNADCLTELNEFVADPGRSS
jgi:AcrR family transcriptional regulator